LNSFICFSIIENDWVIVVIFKNKKYYKEPKMDGCKFLIVLLSIPTMLLMNVNVNAKVEQLYSSCHTGKGNVQLYNCGRQFDLDNDKLAELESHTTPTR